MKEKELVFGGTNLIKKKGRPAVLNVAGYDNDKSIEVWNAEIKDNKNSPAVIGISSYSGDQEESIVLIHKKDCLQLANFLLSLHTEYANELNEIEIKEYSQRFVNTQNSGE